MLRKGSNFHSWFLMKVDIIFYFDQDYDSCGTNLPKKLTELEGNGSIHMHIQSMSKQIIFFRDSAWIYIEKLTLAEKNY
jgi:hypothetical protein